MNPMRRVAALIRNDRGNVSIEFALVAPLLLVLIFAIVEYSLMMFASSLLDNATLIGTRYAITGDVYTATSRRAQVVDTIKQNARYMLDPTKIVIQTTPFSGGYAGLSAGTSTAVGGSDTADDTGNNSARSLGAGCEPILYDVTYPWKFVTPLSTLVNSFLQGRMSSTITLHASALVRNEAFPAPGGGTRCLND